MLFLIDFVVGVTHQQGKAVLTAGGFDAAHHVHRIGVGYIGDDQANQPRLSPFQAPRHLAWTVVELEDSLLDALFEIVRKQVLLTIQVARYAGFTGLGGFRHIADGGPPRGAYCLNTAHNRSPLRLIAKETITQNV
ncbi:hypothetical protein D3C72_1181250 [compost metagenome]